MQVKFSPAPMVWLHEGSNLYPKIVKKIVGPNIEEKNLTRERLFLQ